MQLSPLVAELERLYGLSVDKWFPVTARPVYTKKLLDDRPAITIASRGRKLTVNGWYTPAVWSDTVDDVLDFLSGDDTPQVQRVKAAEIVIAAEALDNPTLVLAELVRQMWCHVNEAARPGAGLYYSRVWAGIAPEFDCTVGVDPLQPSKGLSLLIPNEHFKKWASEVLNQSVWSVSRAGLGAAKAPNRMRKWTCGCTIIRSATIVNATCNACGEKFVYAEKAVVIPPKRVGKRVVK